jgi:hypothetical protein
VRADECLIVVLVVTLVSFGGEPMAVKKVLNI